MSEPTYQIADLAACEALEPGTWVGDGAGNFWCVVNTHLGAPQKMAMARSGRSFIALDALSFPLYEAELTGECKHSRGTNEMGHCVRCGMVVGELRPVTFDAETRQLMHEVALLNARNARRQQDPEATP